VKLCFKKKKVAFITDLCEMWTKALCQSHSGFHWI